MSAVISVAVFEKMCSLRSDKGAARRVVPALDIRVSAGRTQGRATGTAVPQGLA